MVLCFGSMFSATNQKHLFRRFSSFLFIFGFSFALDKVKFPPFYPPPSNDIQNILENFIPLVELFHLFSTRTPKSTRGGKNYFAMFPINY